MGKAFPRQGEGHGICFVNILSGNATWVMPSHKAAADGPLPSGGFLHGQPRRLYVGGPARFGVRMKSRLNLKPGQKGTKKLVEKYGDLLLYVRYRYDENRGVRLKTVELVEEETPWQPSVRFRDGDIVSVPVDFAEKELRDRLKA